MLNAAYIPLRRALLDKLKVIQPVKKWTNLYNKKFRTIVIPNSLALDSVLYHTNLQTE